MYRFPGEAYSARYILHLIKGRTAMDLLKLPVILVDCQTTGSTPPKSRIIEFAWIAIRGFDVSPQSIPDVNVTFCRLPSGQKIPRRISQITGITTDDVVDAPSPREVWKRFCTSLPHDGSYRSKRFLVAHHAQFEERFLLSLHSEVYPDVPFPFRFICTRRIAHHLYPSLPRRSLRAITGLLGCEPGEFRRSKDHVRATAVLWVHLISLLRERFGITDECELRTLLMKRPPRSSNKQYPFPRERRLALSDSPGVYRFKNPRGSILYIGKARSLKARVNSHFTGKASRDDMVECLSQVTDIEIRETTSATEASLIEVEEIAHHEPRYNRALRNEGTDLWFFTRNLSHFRNEPSPDHDRGPFPDHDSIERFHTIFLWLSGTGENATIRHQIRSILGLKRNSSNGTIQEVRSTFVENHGIPVRIAELLSVGRHHIREIGRVSKISDGAVTQMNEDMGITIRVTPDDDLDRSYHRLIEVIVIHCRLIFRSRWLSSLIDSVVAWRRNQELDDVSFRYLVFSGGRIIDSGNSNKVEILKSLIPPPHTKVGRLARLDRIGFNRLRTMNTELKRLVKEERMPVVLRPSGAPIETEHLVKILALM